jgi:hypothetical protein
MARPTTFGADPIDLFDPTPYTALSYYAHIAIGIIALAAMVTAFAATKGGRLHVRAGQAFLLTILVVAASATAMLTVAYVPPLMLAVATVLYAGGTAWLALRPRRAWTVPAELVLAAMQVAALAAFLARAVPAVNAGTLPGVAVIVLSAVPLLMLAGDLRYFRAGAERARLRISRHLSRMVWTSMVAIRAPLVELAAGGLPIPQPLLLFGPVFAGLLAIWYFSRKRRLPVRFVV